MICFIALQMAVLFEKNLKSLQLTWEKAMVKLRQIQVIEWENEGRVRKGLVKVKSEQKEIFQSLGITKPTILSL